MFKLELKLYLVRQAKLDVIYARLNITQFTIHLYGLPRGKVYL